MRRIWRGIGAAALLLGLSGCGGGLGELAAGGIGGTGFTIGSISAFGSIYVNGVKYDTGAAEVSINGSAAAPDQLRLGMVVTLEATLNADGTQGTAQKISFSDEVRGPVESIGSDTLQVAGQTVQVDERTVLDGVDSLAALKIGDFAQVSGLRQNGTILATRVALQAIPDSVVARGQASAVDTAAATFRLGQLTVDYSATALLSAVPTAGQWLQASGRMRDGILYADRLESANPAQPPPNAAVDLRGKITRFESSQDFDLAFRPAQIKPQTRFDFGGAADLRLGAELAARGKLDAQGVLVLDAVEFTGAASGRTPPGRLMISAAIEAITPESRQLRLLGLAISLPPSALLQDPANPQARFGLADLRIGEQVMAHGFLNRQTGEFVAERLQREAAANRAVLQGPATVDGSHLQVLGVNVFSDANSRYFDGRQAPPPSPGQPPAPPAGSEISAAEFLALAQTPGVLVNAGGISNGAAVLAERLVLLPEARP
jgi:hypothetical protein